MLRLLIKFKEKQDGAVVVIVALMMTVLIGMSALVVDLGLAYSLKSELKKDLDSIALAAVRNLPANNTTSTDWINAKKTADEYAKANGINDLAEGDILPVYKDGKIVGITISDSINVTYSFAKVLGFNSGNVSQYSTAELLTVSGMTGLLPIGMPKSVMDIILANNLQGQNITLKFGPKVEGATADEITYNIPSKFSDLSGDSGWRGAINFQDVGSISGKYQDTMAKGRYEGMVNIGDIVEANSGNMPIDVQGNLVVGQEATVPVIDKNAEGKIVVVGFVSFKIMGLEGNNTNQHKVSILTSSYIKDYIVSGEANTNVVTNDYGVKAAKLTH